MQNAAELGAYWEHFDPSPERGEIGVRGLGRDEAAAFEEAALALCDLFVSTKRVLAAEDFEIRCGPAERPRLLAEFLNRVLQLADDEAAVFSYFEVSFEGQCLLATAWGERLDRKRHRALPPPKGALEEQAKVYLRDDGLCCAECLIEP
jgi:tRNA nucleotidyltransferase (CCA-adding enzyme)